MMVMEIGKSRIMQKKVSYPTKFDFTQHQPTSCCGGHFNPDSFKKIKKLSWTISKYVRGLKKKLGISGQSYFNVSDLLFLMILGSGVALVSVAIDISEQKIKDARMELYNNSGSALWIKYVAWTGPTLTLVLAAAVICQVLAPQARGSGIPEMKTILRGVVLKEYLTFKTLIAKVGGLILCVGSGTAVGKEGPTVHIASILAMLLLKPMAHFRKTYKNDNVRSDMLAAGCAAGVACTFGAPIGGVLFSIEVTSVYFAIRNYWRGLFAATCGAVLFRLSTVWFHAKIIPEAFSQTTFSTSMPYQPEELLVHACIGVLCGVLGPVYIITHRHLVLFVQKNRYGKIIFSKNHLVYPSLVVLITASITFPSGLGQFIMSQLEPKDAIGDLFTPFTWQINSTDNVNSSQLQVINRWTINGQSIYVTLASYTVGSFLTSCVANTLPIPGGIFIPTIITGAALGRIVGEFLYQSCHNGLFRFAHCLIVPGSYALVGAAAFTGSVTQTFSPSVIVLELTGQIVYILPVTVAVLISSAISALIQPSFFDSIIRIKNLPYLPAMLPIGSYARTTVVKDIMTPVSEVKCISMETTLMEAKIILASSPGVKEFPLVDTHNSMILLGSIPRSVLVDELKYWRRMSTREPVEQSPLGPQDSEGLPKAVLSTYADEACEATWGQVSAQTSAVDEDGEGQGDATAMRTACETGVCLNVTSNDALPNPFRLLIPSCFRRSHDETKSLNTDSSMDSEKSPGKCSQDRLDFDLLRINNAPMRMVEQTSLYKAHSLFSLLALQYAYVTRIGRLVGVVALGDIRRALENGPTNSVNFRNNNETDEKDYQDRKRWYSRRTSDGLIDIVLHPVERPEVITEDGDNLDNIKDIVQQL